MTCLLDRDQITASGRLFGGCNLRWELYSGLQVNLKSPVEPRSPLLSPVQPLFSFSPALTKLINLSRQSFGGGLFLDLSREFASTERICSCRHEYRPSDNATELDDNLCSKFGHQINPYTSTAKVVGLGSTSHTDLRGNCNLFGSIDHMSIQVIFRCLAASEFTQLPCVCLRAYCSHYFWVFLYYSHFLLH